MFATLPRRQRFVLFTAAMGALFLILAALAVWMFSKPATVYRPGEDIAGLTATLGRTLPQDYPRVTFTDVTSQAGIVFKHFSGERTSQLPEDMGSGAAWGDYDNDGWPDLFIVNQAGPITLSKEEIASSPIRSMLYHNNGDGTFEEVALDAGIDFRGWGMGAAWGDYDNDGWPDLFVTAYGDNVFYHNNGDGTFLEKTLDAGLGEQTGFWAGASWGDYNRDGWLDLYVTGYVRYIPTSNNQQTTMQYNVEAPASINPSSFSPQRNLLYRNDGDGTFTEVAQRTGVDNARGKSLSAAWVDLNDDGWLDLYVANDVSDNVLFLNMGNELFEEISHRALVADYRGAMGLAVGDWDRDEDLDMFVTHWIAQENALYNNMTSQRKKAGSEPAMLQFMDVADRVGLGQIALDYIGWGTFFFDYDNDGWLDLFVANGSTFQQREVPHLLVPMNNQLFWNGGEKRGFFDVSSVSGQVFEKLLVGRGAAYADYDNDGDVDVVVVNHDGPAVLLRNDGGNRNSWLKVELQGSGSNQSAIGARLRLVAGGSSSLYQVGAQSSYCSQNSLQAHFGLGDVMVADSLEITWPSGLRQVFTNIPARQILHIVEGEDESL